MQSIAHIVNPFMALPPSDLFTAQPVTFESMRRARDFASGRLAVHLLSAQFAEDRDAVPPDFTKTRNLTRSVLDIKPFKQRRKLPLIKDILDRAIDESNAGYIVYTNIDIGLMPHFYETLNRIIETGVDAATINRRTLPAKPSDVGDLPMIYASLGERHPGWDCFLFHRDVYSRFMLGTVCIGTPPLGALFRDNILRFSRRYEEFTDSHLTFHLGREKTWRDPRYDDYLLHNREQYDEIGAQLSKGLAADHPFRQLRSLQPEEQRGRQLHTRTRRWLTRRLARLLSS